MAVATTIGLGGGYLLDEKLGTAPWLAVVGLVIGVVAGFKNLVETAKKAQREEDAKDDAGKDDGTA